MSDEILTQAHPILTNLVSETLLYFFSRMHNWNRYTYSWQNFFKEGQSFILSRPSIDWMMPIHTLETPDFSMQTVKFKRFSADMSLGLSKTMAFPGGKVVKNLTANAGDAGDIGSVPGLERFSGEGNGNPLQYSCLENSVDREALLIGYNPWGCKESDITEYTYTNCLSIFW